MGSNEQQRAAMGGNGDHVAGVEAGRELPRLGIGPVSGFFAACLEARGEIEWRLEAGFA